MTPDQLITFSVVAEQLNISRAARHLHLSQPAVSGQLLALQQSFGQALYRRQGRGIQLTAAGQQLRVIADQVRNAMQQAHELKVASQRLETGLLRLGASTTPASYLLPEYVAHFKRKYPGVTVQMVTGNTQQILERCQELDLAFVEGEVDPETADQHDLLQWRHDEVVAIVPKGHRLAHLENISLEQLASEFLVMREQGSGVRKMILDVFCKAELPFPEYLELAGVEGVKQGVRAGLGIGFVSNLSLLHEDGTLVGLRINQGLDRIIRIIIPGRRPLNKPASEFLEQVTQ